MAPYTNPVLALRRAGTAAAIGLLVLVFGSGHAAADDPAPETTVEAVIRSLQTTWNSGDMDGYLARYLRDDSLSLTFGNTVVDGWSALEALFRESYPDPHRMGKFTIDRIDVRLLTDDVAIAYGNFTHVFPHETIHGGFSHVLTRKVDGGWIIRHERTSRGAVIEHDREGE